MSDKPEGMWEDDIPLPDTGDEKRFGSSNSISVYGLVCSKCTGMDGQHKDHCPRNN